MKVCRKEELACSVDWKRRREKAKIRREVNECGLFPNHLSGSGADALPRTLNCLKVARASLKGVSHEGGGERRRF
jgi:hypothetical protein